MHWAKLIAEGDIGIDDTPGYVTETMLMMKDAKNQKSIERMLTGGKKLWDKWHKIKREITGSDNIAVKSTIASMPCGALPSGTGLKLFLRRLMYALHEVRKTKNGEEKEGNDVLDDVGGFAFKLDRFDANLEKENNLDANETMSDSDDDLVEPKRVTPLLI